MSVPATFTRIQKWLDGQRNLVIDWETRLTAIPALGPENGGEGEIKKAELVKTILSKELGADKIEEVRCPDARVPAGYRPNLLAYFNGEDSSRTVWIMSHLDIVPPGDLAMWQTDPYKVIVKDDKVFGRGVEDNQQGLVSSFLAVKALREAGIKPACNVGLTIVADEETGSKFGLRHVIKEKPNAFRKTDLIIIPDAGNSDGTMIEVAEKSILWLKFKTVGKQCHASMPAQGINAHRAAANLIVKLDQLYQTFNLNDPVFDPPISTFEPTKKEANVPNINTIPGEDVFYLDCRILPSIDLPKVQKEIGRIIKEVEQQFQVKISFDSPQIEVAAPPTANDAPVVNALKQAISAIYQRQAKPMGIGGGTVAAVFRRAGYPAAVWSTLDETAHQPNEYAIISNILGDAKVFAHVFLQK